MTRLDFIAACAEVFVPPGLALENEAIREALRGKDNDKVRELLRTEF